MGSWPSLLLAMRVSVPSHFVKRVLKRPSCFTTNTSPSMVNLSPVSYGWVCGQRRPSAQIQDLPVKAYREQKNRAIEDILCGALKNKGDSKDQGVGRGEI